MKTVKKNQAFTLVEMVVAIMIFTIFISMIAGTYLHIARAQKDMAELRKVYSGARDVMEMMREDIMTSSIFYGCYDGEASSISECSGSSTDKLALLDGDDAVIYYADEGEVFMNRYSYENGGWLGSGAMQVSGVDFMVDYLYFGIYPEATYVTIYMDDFQTSVSTRIYEASAKVN